jgi:hypothetical protein
LLAERVPPADERRAGVWRFAGALVTIFVSFRRPARAGGVLGDDLVTQRMTNMMRSMIWLLGGLVVLGFADAAVAQLPVPVPVPVPGQSGNLQRLPDNTVEGLILEYKGTFKASATAAEPEVLEGKFRMEKSAVFDVGGTFRAPTAAELEKLKNQILSGKGGELRLPPKPQQKRIGQYQKTTGDKLRIEFDDKDSLNGTMLLFHKKGTGDVWVGTFAEREGTKLVRTWQVTVRPIED